MVLSPLPPGVVYNRVIFMPQILGILQTLLRKFITFMFIILAICTTCRKKHGGDIAQKTDWLYPKEPEDKTSHQRYVGSTIRFEKRLNIRFYCHLW